MNEGDFELDGYAMGLGLPVVVEGFDPGEASWTVQDVVSPVGGRRLFGRDTLTGPTWVFDMATNTRTPAEARAALSALASAWRPVYTSQPGAESVLRYMVGGEVRRVYGRPRKFAPILNGLTQSGVALASGEFVTSDAYSYADTARLVIVTMTPPPTGGFTAPFTTPIVTVPIGEVQGQIDDVGGEAPAPFIVTFQGPITNPKVSGNGWEIELQTTLAYDRSVTIDTRKATARRSDGANLSGYLTHRSHLGTARLTPGPDYVAFSGVDATGTATCTVTWRPTYHGF